MRDSSRVRQVAVPPDARALSTLPRADYEDAFALQTDAAEERTAEQWARAILEDAPPDTRRMLRCGWSSLGLRLGSTLDERLVLGWTVRSSTADVALLGADSRFGLVGEVLVNRRPCTVLVATFVRLQNPLASALWAPVAPGHRRVVRDLLEQVAARSEVTVSSAATR